MANKKSDPRRILTKTRVKGAAVRFLWVIFLFFWFLPVMAGSKTQDPGKGSAPEADSNSVPIVQPPSTPPPKPGSSPIIHSPGQPFKPGAKMVPQQSDLVITRLEWSKPLTDGDKLGLESVLQCEIQNKGPVPSAATSLLIRGSKNFSGFKDDSRPVPALLPGDRRLIAWPQALREGWPAGTYVLTAVIDPDDLIKDGDRTNNQKSITFTVLPKKSEHHFRPVLGQTQSETSKPDIRKPKAESIPKPLPYAETGVGRRSTTLDIDLDRSAVARPSSGRRSVSMDIDAGRSGALDTQAGKRVTVMDIDVGRAADLNAQVGKRSIVLDIAVDRAIAINTETGKRSILLDIAMDRATVLNTTAGKRSITLDIAPEQSEVLNMPVGKRTIILNIQTR